MVLNLCLPDFNTTVHCNKLCADGYDVTNLVSAEPAVRRRGFKLEYFLRPPVQVTLKFGFLVELCRLDVELWPWGMDQGQACKRLEISTSSDRAQDQKRFHKNDRVKMQMRDQHQDTRGVRSSKMFPGQQWSLQAQQWGDEALPEPQQVTSASLKTESSSSEAQFKLVGRCALRVPAPCPFIPNPRHPSIASPAVTCFADPACIRNHSKWTLPCMSCGPRDRGRCFGPNICCGEGLGCLMGSPETARCAGENYLLTPCQAGGRPCGSEGGRCAVSGLCCNSESCAVDSDCLGETEALEPGDSSAGSSPTELLLRLLHMSSRGQSEY
uniref:Vasotocin-neurophysin VT 1 n=1 Tax=Takifugu rubripes TaxID=31033 RepID=A0A674N7C9_TAKRU